MLVPKFASFKALAQAKKQKDPTELDIFWRAGLSQTALDSYEANKHAPGYANPEVYKIVCYARQDLIHNCFTGRGGGARELSQAYIEWQRERGKALCEDQFRFLRSVLGLDENAVKTREIEDKSLPKLEFDARKSKVQDLADIVFFLRVMADTWRYYGKDLGVDSEPDWWKKANFFYCAARYYLCPEGEGESDASQPQWDFVRYTPDNDVKSLFKPGKGAEFAGLMLNYIKLLDSVAESLHYVEKKKEIVKKRDEIAKAAVDLIKQHLDKVPEEEYKTIRLLFLALKATVTE